MSYSKSLSSYIPLDLVEMRPKGFFENYQNTIKEKYDKINEKSGWEKIESCPICGYNNYTKLLMKYNIEIRKCLNCFSSYNNFFPRDSKDLYMDPAYINIAKNSYEKNKNYRKKRFGSERLNIINQSIGHNLPKTILDIGCGTGWFLEYVRDAGWDIFGQEFADDLVRKTSEDLNISVYKNIDDIPSEKKFSVITLFDLIEHVKNPLELINILKDKLNKNGIILGYTPNIDSYAFSIMKENSNMITPADHLLYFNKESIEFIANKCGMKLIFFESKGIDIGDLISYHEYKNEITEVEFYKKYANELQAMIDASGSGNHLRFVFKD